MHLNYYYFIFIFGAIIGSFLNVVILRYNTGQSIVFGQSKCFSCAKKLKWYELFPVASFIFLRGKCAHCQTKISWQYPITEITTGLLFLLISNLPAGEAGFKSQISNLDVVYYWIIFSLLIIIAVYDYRHQIIPNLFVWIFNGLGFLSLFGIWNFDFGIFDMNGLLAGFVLFVFLLCFGECPRASGWVSATPNWLWELVGFSECQGHSRRHSGLLDRSDCRRCFALFQ